MKLLVVAFALVALAVAAPPAPAESAQIVRSNYDQTPEGGYNFGFETDNGINRQEVGQPKEAPDEEGKLHTIIAVRGSYTYTDDKGEVQEINYTADEGGFHAEGPSIPQ